MNTQNEDMLDLLLKRFSEGITDVEERTLQEMQKAGVDMDFDSIELTAAAIAMSGLRTDDPLPAHLQTKILSQADDYFHPQTVTAYQVESDRGTSWFSLLGWALAAAACVTLAVNLYVTRPPKPPDVVVEAPQPSMAEQRATLMATADATVRSWSDFDPKKPQNVRGDVVWSNSQQKGFVTFKGLPMNDKSKETYQLWIFDEGRNQKTPVDGGVFDVTENGEIIIPIDAKLAIQKPMMFAVTAEKPGGVVVSELGKVMAVAKV